MLSSGYRLDGRPAEEWTAEAIPIDGDFVTSFGQLEKELDMAIGRTLLERYSGRTTQHDGFIRPIRGKKLTYAKVHTCDFGVEKYLTPGEDFYVCSLNTACGDVRVGAMICYGRSSRKAQGFSCSGGLS